MELGEREEPKTRSKYNCETCGIKQLCPVMRQSSTHDISGILLYTKIMGCHSHSKWVE